MVEWSGILLYSTEGSIQDPENMVVTLQDIIPMHKGNQTYTSYNFVEKKRDHSGNEDKHLDYVIANPDAMKYKIGHIHSHNFMGVFFSSTDWDELNDNSYAHNYYLSLIVNNKMEFEAKIAFQITATEEVSTSFKARDGSGGEYDFSDAVLKFDKSKLAVYDCVINAPEPEIVIDEIFQTSVDEIIEKAAKVPVYQKPYAGNKSQIKPAGTVKNQGKKKGKKKHGKQTPNIPPIEDAPFFGESPDIMTDIEEVVIRLLRGTNVPDDPTSTIMEALVDLEAAHAGHPDGDYIAISIINNYDAVYSTVFPHESDENHFIAIGEQVIELLEEERTLYPFIEPTISLFLVKGKK